MAKCKAEKINGTIERAIKKSVSKMGRQKIKLVPFHFLPVFSFRFQC